MRPGSPSTATPDFTGKKCYRLPGEPWDERPCLLIRNPWESEEERVAYTMAVRNNPKGANEGAFAYVVRIAEIVQRGPLGPAVKRMPSRWNEPARPVQGPTEPSYEERLAAIFEPREPGSDDDAD